MKEYRVCVVGAGGRSPDHLNAYKHIPTALATACCDLVPEKAEKRAQEFGLKAYTDMTRMIEAEKPDLVHLVVPPVDRVGMMTRVSELGIKACTVEKPLATNVKEWRQLTALETTSRTRFAVCHQFRWQKHLVKCREALQGGQLGAVKFLDISAGMNIAGQGTHTLDYGMSLNGDIPVARVFGTASGFQNSDSMHPAPDMTAGMLTFENGVRALWTSGKVSPRVGDPKTDWQHVRIAAYADKGRVNYEEFGTWEIVGPGVQESGTFGGMQEWKAHNVLAQAEFHKAMFAWIEDETRRPGTHLKQSLHEWATVLALYQSALERRPIEMRSFDPPEDLFARLAAALKSPA